MSNKKQHNQQPSTEEKLEFFIERAEALSRYFSENFRNADISKISIYRNTDIEGDEWKFHTLTYGLICLIRLFFLQSEPIALYSIMYDVRKQKKLLPENSPLRALSNDPCWYEAIEQATTKINDLFFGIGASPDAELLNLPYSYNGKPVTRLEEFSTIMYGEIIHFNIEKRRTYKQWKKAPGDLFSNLLTDFITIAFYISGQAILPVAGACRRELQRLRGQ
ncbi:MAG: hypothetical protein ACYDER_18895 [Ktedonobacteraceae bacterium]